MMFSGDDFYDDEVTSGPILGDPREYADWVRDQEKNAIACATCGAPDPGVIEDRWCSECPDRAAFLAAREARLTADIVKGNAA